MEQHRSRTKRTSTAWSCRCALAMSAALAGCVLVLGGCSGDPAPETPKAPPTPIAKLNTAAMALPRVAFCSRVPPAAVRDALGTSKWRAAAYRDGDRTGIDGSTDTVAEDGCAWAAESGDALARAWVFAPPADPAMARQVIAEARRRAGCTVTDTPAFGRPTLTQTCTGDNGVRVRHAGLFDTTWLSCEVSDRAKAAAVRKRADAWCVQVVNALNTTR